MGWCWAPGTQSWHARGQEGAVPSPRDPIPVGRADISPQDPILTQGVWDGTVLAPRAQSWHVEGRREQCQAPKIQSWHKEAEGASTRPPAPILALRR